MGELMRAGRETTGTDVAEAEGISRAPRQELRWAEVAPLAVGGPGTAASASRQLSRRCGREREAGTYDDLPSALTLLPGSDPVVVANAGGCGVRRGREQGRSQHSVSTPTG